MIQSTEELSKLLDDSRLQGFEIASVPVLDTREQAFGMEVPVQELESCWRVARRLVEHTGRWPIVHCAFSPTTGGLEQRLIDLDMFSRFFFKEAPDTSDVSPEGIIARSRSVSYEKFLDAVESDRRKYFSLDESLDFELEMTIQLCGKAPTRESLRDSDIQGDYELDLKLFNWERDNDCTPDPELGRQPWFEPDHTYLVFLPTSFSWETLAYINWFGTSDYGSEYYIALGRSWEQRFGAELMAHYGTMLQCFVSSPPSDPETAWKLAREHDLAASCTLALPGIPLRRYAVGLVNYDRWFLHERP